MTDRQMLREKLKDGKDDYKEQKTLRKLMEVCNVKTGMLPEQLYIPSYQVETSFLFELLESMGYHYKCQEEYNSFFTQHCIKITLSKKS